MDADEDHILPGPYDVRDVELLHQPAAFANPDLDAVQPNAVDRLDTVEAQQHPLRGPFRHLKAAPIITSGILIGNVGHIDRERIADIGVDRSPIRTFRSLGRNRRKYPMRRHGDGVPARVVETRIGRRIVKAVSDRRPTKLPISVQAERGCIGH
jgi:hypothetical protein